MAHQSRAGREPWEEATRWVKLVGGESDPVSDALWKRARGSTDPALGLHRVIPGRDDERLRALGFPSDRVAAYVCVGTVCSAPLTDEASLARQLDEAATRHARAD